MGANLAERFRIRGTQRHAWDETLPGGTPAIDAGTRPSAFRRFLDSQQNLPVDSEEAQPVVSAPATERPHRFADFVNQPARLSAVTAPVDSPSGPYVPPDDGQPTLPERPSRFLDFALKAPTTVDDPLARLVQPVPTVARRDPRQEAIAKRDALLADRNPKNTNNKWLEALKAGGRGVLQGGLFGGIARFAQAIAAPNLDEREARDREIKRLSGGIALTDAEAKRALEQQQGEADYNETVAKTDRLRREPLVKPDVALEKGNGPQGYGWYAVDKNKPGDAPVRVPGLTPQDPGKPPQRFPWMGRMMSVVPDGQGGWKAEPLTGTPTDESEVPVPYKPTADSPAFMVKPAEAVRGAAGIEEANIAAGATAGKSVTEAGNTNADREYNAYLSARELEGGRVSDYNGLHDQWDTVTEQLNAARSRTARLDERRHKLGGVDASKLTGNAKKDYEEANENYEQAKAQYDVLGEQYNRVKAQVQAAHDALNSDFVEFRPDERARLKAQKPAPTVQANPAPGRRTGGPVSKQYVDAQAYAKDHNMSVEKARELIRANGHEPAN